MASTSSNPSSTFTARRNPRCSSCRSCTAGSTGSWIRRRMTARDGSTWRRRRVREQNVRPRGPRTRRAAVEGRGRRRALLHALCPTLAGTGANVESVRRHALIVVDNAIAVADYSSPLRQKISDTGKSFGESSLGKCYGTAKAVRSLLTNPRDYVLYAVPDLDNPGTTDSYSAGRRFGGGSDSNNREAKARGWRCGASVLRWLSDPCRMRRCASSSPAAPSPP